MSHVVGANETNAEKNVESKLFYVNQISNGIIYRILCCCCCIVSNFSNKLIARSSQIMKLFLNSRLSTVTKCEKLVYL